MKTLELSVELLPDLELLSNLSLGILTKPRLLFKKYKSLVCKTTSQAILSNFSSIL